MTLCVGVAVWTAILPEMGAVLGSKLGQDLDQDLD
jgi:hypothetical protein